MLEEIIENCRRHNLECFLIAYSFLLVLTFLGLAYFEWKRIEHKYIYRRLYLWKAFKDKTLDFVYGQMGLWSIIRNYKAKPLYIL
ncbi:MAG: hypothetical protein DSY42_03070 [Aquifex sp.]|nr:MAG: hypothetical protein DSY42_03070 [Aquifex sp.]